MSEHLEKLEQSAGQANRCLNRMPLALANKTEVWQDFCTSMHALLDLALDPRATVEERGCAWSHLQQWRAWGMRRI